MALVISGGVTINGTLDGSAVLETPGPGGARSGRGMGKGGDGAHGEGYADSGGGGDGYGSAGKDGGRAVGYTMPLVGGIGGLTYPIADLGLKMAVGGGSAGGLAGSPGCVAHGGGVAAPFKSAAGGTGLALGGGGQGATKASAATAGEDVDSNAGGGGGFGRIVIRTRAADSLNGTISPDPTLRTDL